MRTKKGNAVTDSAVIFIVIFLMLLIFLITSFVADITNNIIQDDPDMSAESKAISSGFQSRFATTLDYGLVLGMVVFWIFALIVSWLLPTHPAFMALSIVLLLALSTIIPHFSNIYDGFLTSFTGLTTATFPFMNTVMNNLVLFYWVFALSIAGVLYMKFRGGTT